MRLSKCPTCGRLWGSEGALAAHIRESRYCVNSWPPSPRQEYEAGLEYRPECFDFKLSKRLDALVVEAVPRPDISMREVEATLSALRDLLSATWLTDLTLHLREHEYDRLFREVDQRCDPNIILTKQLACVDTVQAWKMKYAEELRIQVQKPPQLRLNLEQLWTHYLHSPARFTWGGVSCMPIISLGASS